MKELVNCRLCPRKCNADRIGDKPGVCGVLGEKVIISRAALHMWEEPCISGEKGSGAVFFAGCSLKCVYCQNYNIAHFTDNIKNDCKSNNEKETRYISLNTDELSDVFLRLQDQGAHNINLVTPSHYALHIIEALCKAKKRGLHIPIVYNCSGYESVSTLRRLEGIVDIYLTDFKYMDKKLAKSYSGAEDYPEVASYALSEMVRQFSANNIDEPLFDDNGMMKKGIIVRNLLLPNHVNNSKAVIKYVYEKYGDLVYISIMNQYTPLKQVENIPDLNRRVTKREYERLLDFVMELGVKNAFIQEGNVAKESFIPDFDGSGVC